MNNFTIFENLFNDILYNKVSNLELEKKNIYGLGIEILTDNNYTIEQKELVINKLSFLFLDNYELDYYLGYIYKDLDKFKALKNFHNCWIKNKYYVENILDYTKILFELDLYDKIIELNVNNYFEELNDSRMLVLVGNIYIKKHQMEKAKTILEKIINDENSSTKSKIMAYCNISGIHGKLVKISNGLEYLVKALKLAKLNYENMDIIKPIITDILLLKDYIYLNKSTNKIVNITYDILNWMYPKICNFKFEKIKKDKINIGYISYDFVDSVITNFFQPVVNSHSGDIFNIYLFDNNNKNISYLANSDIQVYNIGNLNSIDGANLIYSKNIDVLIDLSGHTSGNRLDIFSLNPAPIQITWLGYPNTTGLKSIQYRICDEITDPIDTTQYYSEKLLRLPKCFLLYKNMFQSECLEKNFSKFDEPNYMVILGSLNKDSKISDEVLLCWKAIMKTNTNTKIIIKINSKDSIKLNEDFYLKNLHIDKSRIEIIGYVSNHDYFKLLNTIDILLDTFPYSGTTTTCNSLWNSVPVITMYYPNLHVHNVSSSLLINSGLGELVAKTTQEYIDKVVELSLDTEKIKYFHKTISNNFKNLMNSEIFIKNYEKLLCDLYKDFYNLD